MGGEQPVVSEAEKQAEEKMRAKRQEQSCIQARESLKDGLSRILLTSAPDFDAHAANAFGVFKNGLKLCAELPDDSANELLSELSEKRQVLEFLCRLAKEKRMYCKQVQFALDVLLKETGWQTTWQDSVDLRARVPANLRNNYEGEEESTAEQMAREAQEELLALQAGLSPETKKKAGLSAGLSPEKVAAVPASPTESTPSSSQEETYQKPKGRIESTPEKGELPVGNVAPETAVDKCPTPTNAGVESGLAEESRYEPLPGTHTQGLPLRVVSEVRPRKRDKLKAIFRRSFMCFDRSDAAAPLP